LSRDKIWAAARLSTGATKDYGFGWHLAEYRGHRLVFHGGAWQGFKSFIIRFLDTKLTIVFLANSWETRDFKFARELAASFYPEFALPAVNTIADSDPKTTALVRRGLMQLATDKIDEQLFTPDCRTALVSQGKGIHANLNALSLPVAIIHSSELVESRVESDLRVNRYLLTDIGRSLLCTVKLAKDNKIAAIEVVDL
jgi:hypothetical protein